MRIRNKNRRTVKSTEMPEWCLLRHSLWRNANGRNVSFRNSPQCLIYVINSDKIKLSRYTPTEVASQFPPKRAPFLHFQFRFLPKTERFRSNSVACGLLKSRIQILTFICEGNVGSNRLAVKGVGRRLSTSIPSLPVRRLETNRGEVCRGSGTTCRPLADYSTEDNRELAAIELPIR